MAELSPMVQARLLGEVGLRVHGITDVTRQKVQSVIESGLSDGLGAAELGRLVESSAGFAQYRAEVIARTETNRILNLSQIATFKDYGIAQVRAIDGDDDAECAARNGQVYSVEEAANIHDHPNGTLDWAPVVFTEEPNPEPPPKSSSVEDEGAQLREDFAQWQDDLLPAEREALELYQSSRYRDINATLRGQSQADVAGEVQALDRALAKGRVPRDVTAYRAIPADALPQGTAVGHTITDLGYMSTSVSKRVGAKFVAYAADAGLKPVLIQMKVKAGARGGYLDGLLTSLNERELMLPRGQTLRVLEDTVTDVVYDVFEYRAKVRKLTVEIVDG